MSRSDRVRTHAACAEDRATTSAVGLLVFLICLFTAAKADALTGVDTLKKLSLEELMNVEVTSVSKREEPLMGAAAAIAVVSNDDLRQSGATTIPDALRFVPGLYVGAQNSNGWAVSSRGFSSVNSEKLLVLSDTRSIYTPLYSGVFWDVQDYLMEDIDRIEIIRGPGAALWGSNAVNGVINITTKSAKDTQGLYLEGGAGTEERAFAGARFGGETSGGVDYRVFAKYFDRDGSFTTNPVTSDDWRLAHAGFRSDFNASTDDAITVQSDVYRGEVGQLAPSITIIGRQGPTGDLDVKVSGGNVLGRWRRTLSADSNFELRAYYDRTRRDDPSYFDTLETMDIDFQHQFGLASYAQQILWGASYRYTLNHNEGKGIFALNPPSSNDAVISGFVQDQAMLSSTWHLTVGSKFEHNDFSGFEVQPSVSLAWTPTTERTLWASIARAVRVPTRLERDIAVDVTNPGANPGAVLLGNRKFASEKLLAYELGAREQLTPTLFLDAAVYLNRYQGLASLELGTPFVDAGSGRTIFPILNENLTDGTAQGFELLATYHPLDYLRIVANYTFTHLELDPHGQDLNRGKFLEGSTPRHQVGLRTYVELPNNVELSVQARHLTAIEHIPAIVSGEGIDGYTEVSARIAWHPSNQIEFSIVGQNLLHERHLEFGDLQTRGELQRGVYGKIAWRL